LLFLGECGEYELLFTVRPNREAAFLSEARKSGCIFHRLGMITQSGRALKDQDRTLDMSSWQVQARDFESPEAYLHTMVHWLGRQEVSCESSLLAQRS
jgi:thiamine-monophosphate kinase